MTIERRRHGTIDVLEISAPPVNALGAAVRQALQAAVQESLADNAVDAIIICGSARAFSGGADIREFGKSPVAPILRDLLCFIDDAAKPVVAAMAGFALGGGLELALACDARVARRDATFALPEVKLGLIPGAGGTQRLPRLVGLENAADLITTGQTIDAARAHEIGLVDRLVDDDAIAAALAVAGDLVAGRTIERAVHSAPAAFDESAYRQRLLVQSRGRIAPMRALDAVLASAHAPLKQGLEREKALFLECMASDQRKALIHVFQSERSIMGPSGSGTATARPVDLIGIIGAGTMGAGIAISALAAGYRVLLVDKDAGALAGARRRIEAALARDVEKGRINQTGADARLASLSTETSLAALGDCDLVIEAIVENMDVKRAVFAELSRIAKPGAVLASNTSYLDIDVIAAATDRPRDVIGMHFFSPANIMRLLEVICARAAAPDALMTAFAVGKRMGKTCVPSGVGDGFIGNRIFKLYRETAEMVLEDGALPHEVDAAMRAFSFAMGPFEVSDLAGIDIAWANRRREDATRDPARRYVGIGDRLYDLGRLGQKTGSGWYRYESGSRTPHRDEVVERIIRDESAEKGIVRRAFSLTDIQDRLVLTMINEGARLLGEGVAMRPADIDLVMINGYGFPDHTGGPMFLADMLGLDHVRDAIGDDPGNGAPAAEAAPILSELLARGENFASLNRAAQDR